MSVFYRAEDDLYDLSTTGKYRRDFYKFFNILNVTIALSIYANQREDDIDDVQYEKFNTLLNADNYSTE